MRLGFIAMNLLEKWSPVTDDFAIVNAPINRAVTAYCAWMTRLGQACNKVTVEDSIDAAFVSLAPLSMSMTKKLFISAGTHWTAFFQNGVYGSDPAAGGRQLSVELDVIGMRICATPLGCRWEAAMWEVYAPQRLGGDDFGNRRALASANDGGRWVFVNEGEPYPFEQRRRYLARRKGDRFDRELLRQYLTEVAVDPFEPGVLSVSSDRPAIRLDVGKQGKTIKTYSYAEAVALHRS